MSVFLEIPRRRLASQHERAGRHAPVADEVQGLDQLLAYFGEVSYAVDPGEEIPGMKRQPIIFAILAVGMIALGQQPAQASPRTPRIEGSPSLRTFLDSAEIESAEVKSVETLDGTSLYQLTLTFGELRKPLTGLNVEYELRAAEGTTAGGGMFTVAPEMLTPDRKGISVLTGFGGLKISSKHLLMVKVVDLGLASEARRGQEKNITDTCTTYCDSCADKGAALCTQGVSSYSCSCGPDTRSCSFTCQAGKPQI